MEQQVNKNERNGSTQTGTRGLRKDIREFAHDVLTLAELQAQLLVADVQECGQSSIFPSLLLLCGVAIGLACAPIALIAVALSVVEIFNVSYALGFLLTAIVFAGLGGTLCAIGAFRLRNCFKVLNRSGNELKCNVSWMKNLLSPNRMARNQVSNKV